MVVPGTASVLTTALLLTGVCVLLGSAEDQDDDSDSCSVGSAPQDCSDPPPSRSARSHFTHHHSPGHFRNKRHAKKHRSRSDKRTRYARSIYPPYDGAEDDPQFRQDFPRPMYPTYEEAVLLREVPQEQMGWRPQTKVITGTPVLTQVCHCPYCRNPLPLDPVGYPQTLDPRWFQPPLNAIPVQGSPHLTQMPPTREAFPDIHHAPIFSPNFNPGRLIVEDPCPPPFTREVTEIPPESSAPAPPIASCYLNQTSETPNILGEFLKQDLPNKFFGTPGANDLSSKPGASPLPSLKSKVPTYEELYKDKKKNTL